jgi:hypothetical protein
MSDPTFISFLLLSNFSYKGKLIILKLWLIMTGFHLKLILKQLNVLNDIEE